jgi:5-methylcytosine-specific restriction enzyme A
MAYERGPHHQWYGLGRWKKLRRAQLSHQPLCESCMKRNIFTPATVADHVEPHRGDETAFWDGKLQSLCARCHNGIKQQKETIGYSREIGLDGFPTDPQHPFYQPACNLKYAPRRRVRTATRDK